MALTKTRMRGGRLLLALCALLWLPAGFAQTAGFEGVWYGTINPPGARFDIAVNLQRRDNGWTGALLMEDGTNIPLSAIAAKEDAITFSLDPGGGKVTFTGK